MAAGKGTLVVDVTDLAGEVVRGPVTILLTRLPGDPGVGGQTLTVTFATPARDLVITNIDCRGGLGTMYRVQFTTPHYRPYTFLQLIREERENPASDDVEFWVKPGDVTDIGAPAFDDLSASVRRILNDATMVEQKTEDHDLVGLSGNALYRALGPLRKACLLNLAAKLRHLPTVGDNHQPFIEGLLIARQDRCFARVTSGWPDALVGNLRFTSADSSLHNPPAGFALTGQSFKSRDAFGGIQMTFMRETATGALAADIDIDKAAGFKHGFEVIGNAVLHNRTNPYAVRELLLATDPIDRSLDPGYQFRF
jgi:hypothetical protein